MSLSGQDFCMTYGWIPEWPKGTDCKSAGNAFEGSNPSPPIRRSKPKRLKSFSAHCVLMRAIRTVLARMSDVIAYNTYAAVAELADAQDLKSCGGDIVPVRFRSAALILSGRSLLRKGLLLFFCLAVERAEENSLQINRKVLY